MNFSIRVNPMGFEQIGANRVILALSSHDSSTVVEHNRCRTPLIGRSASVESDVRVWKSTLTHNRRVVHAQD